jgi:hypothetical protein
MHLGQRVDANLPQGSFNEKEWRRGPIWVIRYKSLRPRRERGSVANLWSIRTKLQIEGRARDPAMFNLAIDSKLRGCDVVAVRVEDVTASVYTADRATVRQKKTGGR